MTFQLREKTCSLLLLALVLFADELLDVGVMVRAIQRTLYVLGRALVLRPPGAQYLGSLGDVFDHFAVSEWAQVSERGQEQQQYRGDVPFSTRVG